MKLTRDEHAETRAGHVDKDGSHVDKNDGHVDNLRTPPTKVLTIPDVGTPRTILRYTDKRYGQARSVAIDMGPETKLREGAEVVK